MRILFLCTDNYTRSVIAEFCLINYIQTKHINGIEVASAGFNSNSDISKFSNVHFKRMNELGIDTSNFVRNQFREQFFQEFDVIIAMGKEHKEYVKQNFGRTISLFNEVYKNEVSSLVVPPPDKKGYKNEIKNMVDYINDAVPMLLEKVKNETVH